MLHFLSNPNIKVCVCMHVWMTGMASPVIVAVGFAWIEQEN